MIHRFLPITTKELIDYAMWSSELLPFDPMEKQFINYLQIQEMRYRFLVHNDKGISAIRKTADDDAYFSDTKQTVIASKGAPEGILKLSGLTKRKQMKYIK